MELGSVTLKRIGFFCFPIKHSTHTLRFVSNRNPSLESSSAFGQFSRSFRAGFLDFASPQKLCNKGTAGTFTGRRYKAVMAQTKTCNRTAEQQAAWEAQQAAVKQ
jgi:hypothetical protein